MPRLSDYLQKEATPALPTAAASAAATAAIAHPSVVAAATPSQLRTATAAARISPEAAVAADIARLQRQHAHRLRDHGPRMYRHPDGQLLPHPPPPQPFTVANRQKWSGLVKHCRVQPGVDQQLDRSGVSARYNVNTTYEQHVAALAASGINPEIDTAGAWNGARAEAYDPLSSSGTAQDHPLAWAEWRLLTRSVLQRAVELQGQDTLDKNGWQDLWEAVEIKLVHACLRTMTFAKLFAGSAQVANYANHRPTYPNELYRNILDIAGDCKSLAVDIGCGSGQCTVALAGLFDKVIGQDGSQEQLRFAKQLPNIEYQHRDACDTKLPDECADLVTVAQALHWFDHAKFYREVRRILQPTGTFAAWTYSLPILYHRQHPAQEVLLYLYHDVLGAYWAKPRRHVETGYRGIEPTPDDFSVLVRRELETSEVQTVDHLLGYLRSWSAYASYMKQHSDRPDPLDNFKVQLMKVLGATDSSTAQLTVITPLSLIMAKEPVPVRAS